MGQFVFGYRVPVHKGGAGSSVGEHEFSTSSFLLVCNFKQGAGRGGRRGRTKASF